MKVFWNFSILSWHYLFFHRKTKWHYIKNDHQFCNHRIINSITSNINALAHEFFWSCLKIEFNEEKIHSVFIKKNILHQFIIKRWKVFLHMFFFALKKFLWSCLFSQPCIELEVVSNLNKTTKETFHLWTLWPLINRTYRIKPQEKPI